MTPSAQSQAAGWREGLRAGLSIVPTFVAIFAGFGVAAEVAGVPAWGTLALTVTVFAAPAQFAMLELGGQGPAAVLQMIVAGMLVNLRFLLMSLTLAHLFRGVPRRRLVLTAQIGTKVMAVAAALALLRVTRSLPLALFAGVGVAAALKALGL